MSYFSDVAERVPAVLKTRGGALALVAALQLGVLGWIVAERVRLLAGGREIVLPIVPVDPRDLFKGDYVRLAYPISTLPAGAPETTAGTTPAAKKTPVFVTLKPEADGGWSVASTSRKFPTQVAGDQIVLRGFRDVDRWRSNGPVRVTYGLERYYVPEGKGPALEQLARDKKLAAIVAVDGRGNAAIKGLSADGKKIYDEPLF